VTNTSGLANPFLTVTAIGTTINTANTLIAASGATASTGAFAAGKSIAGSFGAGGLVGLFHWVQPIALAVMALLAGTGFTLAYLIPFMPIMTWVLMLVNYLQTVIQGFVAAPLAVIQMATPEGEGISGTRMERAWALMAAMVARPPLMIVGLVAAVVLSYVGFAILNAFFWRVAEMSTSISPMSLIALLILYTSFALFVMKRCIEAMRILPDTILDWFSSGVGGAFSDASGATPFQEQSRSMTDAAGGIQQKMLKHGQNRRNGNKDPEEKGDGKGGSGD
jgi:conjugal transfer/type IV secretion protein DotA/TraY